ncbi:hypothetical protein MEL_086 [Melbournevirus]|uniref:hypothetical protein n=1 Tax=Melbournevirus TaxID=1560514 RepID=UPI00051F5C61|nr:hypothetical protein MEL_086 [Melbournevirus]
MYRPFLYSGIDTTIQERCVFFSVVYERLSFHILFKDKISLTSSQHDAPHFVMSLMNTLVSVVHRPVDSHNLRNHRIRRPPSVESRSQNSPASTTVHVVSQVRKGTIASGGGKMTDLGNVKSGTHLSFVDVSINKM